MDLLWLLIPMWVAGFCVGLPLGFAIGIISTWYSKNAL
jgi:hypothetical protein